MQQSARINASASSASSSSTIAAHTVGLFGDVNKEYFENSTSKFKIIRVTIHTTGAWPNGIHSDNHVTMLLLLEEGGAIQIDMRTDPGDRRGQLVWKHVAYQQSNSAIVQFDYELSAVVEVWTLYRAIRYDWGLDMYLFSSGGSGCHHWK
jgi:hypothetical protein